MHRVRNARRDRPEPGRVSAGHVRPQDAADVAGRHRTRSSRHLTMDGPPGRLLEAGVSISDQSMLRADRSIQQSGVICAIPILAGLHHQYVRV